MTVSSTTSGGSAGNSNVSAGQGGGNAATGGGDSSGGFDLESIINPMREELSSLKTTTERAVSGSQKAQQRLDAVTRALSGDEGNADEADESDGWYDTVLSELIAAKAKGFEMPITGRMAQVLQATQEEQKRLKAELKKAQAIIEKTADPYTQQDNNAYAQMDSMLVQEVQKVWGDDANQNQFRAVAGEVTAFIKQVKDQQPEKWAQIRHNPRMQQRIVSHFVNQSIPPAHRNLMQETQEAAQPITRADIVAALEEAKTIKDPAQRAKVVEICRQRLFETMANSRAR
jgi:hypothetical protein